MITLTTPLTRYLFKYLWKPNRLSLAPHDLDYGHEYLYEPVFCRDDSDLKAVVEKCSSDPKIQCGVLDIAGGGGRVSLALAARGIPVTLLDNSMTMLRTARTRAQSLRQNSRHMRFVHQCLEECHFDRRFQWIVSINNGFEHVGGETKIAEALRHVLQFLLPGGQLLVDVHNPSHLPTLPGWASCEWRYQGSPCLDSGRAHIWMKTATSQDGSMIEWEHAIAHRSVHYRHLRTRIWVMPEQDWLSLFAANKLTVVGKWGSWEGHPISDTRPKMIFQLEKSPLAHDVTKEAEPPSRSLN